MPVNQIRRALVSVSDKSGLIELCQELTNFGVEIISTGGTSKHLRKNNIPTVEISEITGYPEMMDGRVKTLHPKVHAALLAREEDLDGLLAHQIQPIDLLVVNLYPFSETVAKDNCTLDLAIDNIDIGGPAMLRAAAKNYRRVTVISDQNDYNSILCEMKENKGSVTEATRYDLAKKAFALTARYDSEINHYLCKMSSENIFPKLPDVLLMELHKKTDLRYGENPHQRGALYIQANTTNQGVAQAKLLQGKELSFNNLADADAAFECVKSFDSSDACVIVKHANPCGVACSTNQLKAYEEAYASDPISAFVGIIAFNRELKEDTASTILANQFVEVVIAPGISKAAAKVFSKKPAIRLLSTDTSKTTRKTTLEFKCITEGILIQDVDNHPLDPNAFRCVTKIKLSKEQLRDLQFAWLVVRHVKSNAVVYAKNQKTIGIGAGQMSRIDSINIAAQKANSEIMGCVMASDAFFPFRDAIDAAAKFGISAIIQPGGSVRDQEVIAAADEANIAMVFTGIRHFRH